MRKMRKDTFISRIWMRLNNIPSYLKFHIWIRVTIWINFWSQLLLSINSDFFRVMGIEPEIVFQIFVSLRVFHVLFFGLFLIGFSGLVFGVLFQGCFWKVLWAAVLLINFSWAR
jgi:hypothetical protein